MPQSTRVTQAISELQAALHEEATASALVPAELDALMDEIVSTIKAVGDALDERCRRLEQQVAAMKLNLGASDPQDTRP